MFKTIIPLTGIMLGLLSVGGCGSSSNNSATPPASQQPIQEDNAAQNGTSQSQDAATQSLMNMSSPTGEPVNTSSHEARAVDTVAGGLSSLDLTRTANANWVVNISALTNADGSRMFPNLSGSFSVASSGNAVTSWPVGIDTQANGTLTVTFDQGNVVYTDPANGATATITNGSYTFSYAANYNQASLHNWTLSLDTSLAVPSGSPLSWTVQRPSGAVHALTLAGYRHVNWQEMRAYTAGTTNSLAITRTIDGAPLPGTTSPMGVANVDPANPSRLFTNWDYADNGDAAVWNRYDNATLTYTFGPPVTSVTGGVTQEIYITENGVVMGPFTSLGLAHAYLVTSTD